MRAQGALGACSDAHAQNSNKAVGNDGLCGRSVFSSACAVFSFTCEWMGEKGCACRARRVWHCGSERQNFT
eukprot:1673647-Pleurochrysis_carterae.AAC.2